MVCKHISHYGQGGLHSAPMSPPSPVLGHTSFPDGWDRAVKELSLTTAPLTGIQGMALPGTSPQ